MLPFLVLPLYGSMRAIDRDYLKAAANLGASPTRAFWQVFFPLSLPGLLAGALIVFILCLGFYVTPAVLGGGKVIMVVEPHRQRHRDLLQLGRGQRARRRAARADAGPARLAARLVLARVAIVRRAMRHELARPSRHRDADHARLAPVALRASPRSCWRSWSCRR